MCSNYVVNEKSLKIELLVFSLESDDVYLDSGDS